MNIILLVHRDGKVPLKVVSKLGEEIGFTGTTCTAVFWELAERFPQSLIAWCEEDLQEYLQLENWRDVFHHDLIMASYSVITRFLSDHIGYIDRFPFINVKGEVLYGTWQMSRDVGGIKGEVLMRFKSLLGSLGDFEYLLNSIGKLGQQNGLICYSVPSLITSEVNSAVVPTATKDQLFSFTYRHYNTFWTSGLLFSFLLFEKSFPLTAYLKSFFKIKFFRKKINLSNIALSSSRIFPGEGIDVIIPTMGRSQYLLKVLEDLSAQSLLPLKVIIVEQNGNTDAESELPFLTEKYWPFEVIHHFTHRVGVCHARNLALASTSSDWVFLSDDDLRFGPDLLEEAIRKLKQYGNSCIITSCLQSHEKKKFQIPKQWGTFGSGHSIVHRNFLKDIRFNEIYEFGYGEDVDFGMQLRNIGCDIFYEPALEIQHLKAPVGGFREEVQRPWAGLKPEPKPSPTLMAFIKDYYTEKQTRGYQLELMIRFYNKQKTRNPFNYFKEMKQRWRISEHSLEKMTSVMSMENAVPE